MKVMETVLASRNINRISPPDIIHAIFDDFFELCGDRSFGDDSAILGGIGTLCGIKVTVIGINKGKDIKERLKNNYGMPHPEGYRKSLRLMKQAEKFNRPVICLIDTAGAYAGIGAEERGQGHAISSNIMEMMRLKVPVISVLTGEGGSGGALALAVADKVWMLEKAIYSVISPEGCASILWKDAKMVERAAKSLKLTAKDLKEFGIIDDIIEENDDILNSLKSKITESLTELIGLDKNSLIQNRYDKFRRIGY